jgi:hypothetical protein
MATFAIGPRREDTGGTGVAPRAISAAARRPDTMAIFAIGPRREDTGGTGVAPRAISVMGLFWRA